MENNLFCMIEFTEEEFEEFLIRYSKTCYEMIKILENNNVKLSDIITCIWFNETKVRIFEFPLLFIKCIPQFIADFNLSRDCINKLIRQLRYISGVTEHFEIKELSISMITELEKEWL